VEEVEDALDAVEVVEVVQITMRVSSPVAKFTAIQ
jgi:flavin-binding protein dodecin